MYLGLRKIYIQIFHDYNQYKQISSTLQQKTVHSVHMGIGHRNRFRVLQKQINNQDGNKPLKQ